jgi:hypothetical protein
MDRERAERGRVMVGMIRALAEDVHKTIARLVAPQRAQNPTAIDTVAVCAAGLAFHQMLGEYVARQPEADREPLRRKIMEWAENTAADRPTPALDGLKN